MTLEAAVVDREAPAGLPTIDFEALQGAYVELAEGYKTLAKEFDGLAAVNATLREELKDRRSEREQLTKILEAVLSPRTVTLHKQDGETVGAEIKPSA